MSIRLFSLCLALAFCASACGPSLRPEMTQVAAVPADNRLQALSTDSLSSVSWSAALPAGWQTVGTILPQAMGQGLTTEAGAGIWLGAAPTEALLTDWTHRGLRLRFSFLCLEGSELILGLTPDIALHLHAHDAALPPSGSVYVQGELTQEAPAGMAAGPGLWQTLTLRYQPPVVAEDGELLLTASLQEVSLNGSILFSELPLAGTFADPAPVSWQVSRGQAAIKDLGYRLAQETPEQTAQILRNRPTIMLPQLRYQYAEGEHNRVPALGSFQAEKSGAVQQFFPSDLETRPNNYAIWYEGTFTTSIDATYQFATVSDDGSVLYVDGEKVVDNDGKHGMEEKIGEIFLEKGPHQLSLGYYQGGGGGGLEVYYGSEHFGLEPLNSPVELAKTADATPDTRAYELDPAEEVILQRGFVAYPAFDPEDPANRQTHAMAVGDPAEVHYVFDMESGSLLQTWRGGFIDLRNMWDNRGQAQTALPLAAPLNPASRTNWAWLESPAEAWPDTVQDEGTYQFEQYELDAEGRPTFTYRWGPTLVTDQVQPDENGNLTRQLRLEGAADGLYLALAQGQHIYPLEADGSYLVEGPGFWLRVLASDGWEYVLQQGENGDLLLTHPVSGSATLRYELAW